jgi:flagellar hook protein FlgE
MSLMKSLGSAVSGLRAFQTQMNVIGNNIANVNTPGFKGSDVSFADMFSQSIGSGGSEDAPNASSQVGLGVNIAAISRDFGHGSLQSTGVDTDLSIKGDGFFIVSDGGQNYLTRAGDFAFNKEGYLVTPDGEKVQGYNANNNGQIVSGGTTDDVRVDFNHVMQPQATGKVFVAGNLNADTSKTQISQAQLAFTKNDSVASESTDLADLDQASGLSNGDKINFDITSNDGTAQSVTYTYQTGDTLGDLTDTLNNQLDSKSIGGKFRLVDGLMVLRADQPRDSQLKVDGVNVTNDDINIPNFQVTQQGSTNSHNISSTVYDDLGQAHTLALKLTQTGNNKWSYEASFLNGEKIDQNDKTGTITFDKSGNLSGDSTIPITFDPGSGAEQFSFNVKLGDPAAGSKLTQFSGSTSAKVTSQNGYKQGELTDYNIDGDGNIIGQYSNGRTTKLAQIAIGSVANKDGLEAKGNNLFQKTAKSGDITAKSASELATTSLQSDTLEGSNVKLAEQFTDMISTQRAYQANARVITTSDKLLQEVVNLKR